ncbi:DNA/RNA non-specific endonuclease [Streptomyces sp. NPDC090025]|uniref:DNA/RNA non-specific endonuclease n=1 Tax=Streptomyces sp. NPDC090025 TaxID=3365922 RepID=UPI003835FCFF
MHRGGNRALGAGVASGIAIAMLLTGCKAGGDDNDPAGAAKGGGSREAFVKAAAALRDAPNFGYRMSAPGGLSVRTRATREGAAIGTMTVGGSLTNTLTVGGKTYVKWHDKLPGAGAGAGTGARPGQAELLKDKWVTGSALPGTGGTLTPKLLGTAVAQQLNQPGIRFPERDETVTVDGKSAWKASGSLSDIYVTSTAPHRVVRIAPKGSGLSGLSGLPSMQNALPTALPSALLDVPGIGRASRSARRGVPRAPAATAQIDVDELTRAEVDELFDELVSNTRQLAKSADMSYQFNASGSAAFTGCGPAACSVTVTITSRFVSAKLKPPTNINAMMTVSMTGSGSPVGGCATSGTLPVNATGSLACTNTSPAWAAWYSRARNTRGTHVYTALAQVVGNAMSEAAIDYLIEELQRLHEEHQRERFGTGTPSGSPSPSRTCTPQPPVYGPLDSLGRGTSGHVVLCDPPPTGSAASVAPRGYNPAIHDGGHLIGARFGGAGNTFSNIVTLYRTMNQVVMRTCENRVADLVKAESPVDYTVTATYVPGLLIPASVTMTARGDKGTVFHVTLPNTPSAAHACKK